MKFRVDFVTNSSSMSEICVTISTKDGRDINVAPGLEELFVDGELDISQGKLYAWGEEVKSVLELAAWMSVEDSCEIPESAEDVIEETRDYWESEMEELIEEVQELSEISKIVYNCTAYKYGEELSYLVANLQKNHPGEFEEDCKKEITPDLIKKWEGYIDELFVHYDGEVHAVGDIEGALKNEDMILMLATNIVIENEVVIDFSSLRVSDGGNAEYDEAEDDFEDEFEDDEEE